jgi:poly(hydroxyalkanoate) depolymerase family esterase
MKFTLVLAIPLILHSVLAWAQPPNFEVYEPKGAHAGAPMMVALSGCRQDIPGLKSMTRLNELADQKGIYVLYLSPPRTNPLGCWKWFLPENQAKHSGELKAIMDIVAQQSHAHSVAKLYLLGISSGAAQVANLAACYPEAFAGIALHSGVSYGLASSLLDTWTLLTLGPHKDQAANSACLPRDFAGATVVIHGKGDAFVNPSNADRIVADFVQPKTLRQNKSKIKKAGIYEYEQIEFFEATGRLKGLQITIDQLGHAWSGAKDGSPLSAPNGPDATAMIWDFFLASDSTPP